MAAIFCYCSFYTVTVSQSTLAHNKMTPPEISIVGSGDPKNEFRVRVASSKLGQILGPSFSYKIRAKFKAQILTIKFGPNFFLYFEVAQIYTVKIGPNF